MWNKRCLSRLTTCKTHVYPCTTSLSGGFGPRRKQYQSMHTTMRVKLQNKLQIPSSKVQIANHKLQITTNYLQVIVAVERHLGTRTNGIGHLHVPDPHCCRSFVNKSQLFDKSIREIYLLKTARPIDRTVERDVDLHFLSSLAA